MYIWFIWKVSCLNYLFMYYHAFKNQATEYFIMLEFLTVEETLALFENVTGCKWWQNCNYCGEVGNRHRKRQMYRNKCSWRWHDTQGDKTNKGNCHSVTVVALEIATVWIVSRSSSAEFLFLKIFLLEKNSIAFYVKKNK